jgi:hypothetical protein
VAPRTILPGAPTGSRRDRPGSFGRRSTRPAPPPVGGLGLLRIATARGQLDCTNTDRAAIGVETLQRLLGGAASNRVGRLLDRRFRLQQATVKPNPNLNRHLLSRSPNYLRHHHTFSNVHRRLHHTSQVYIMSRPRPLYLSSLVVDDDRYYLKYSMLSANLMA